MANPNNLIRPPILNPIPNNPPTPPVERNNIPDMDVITRLVQQQCQIAVQQILNPNADIAGDDQTIEDRFKENITELDKIPDVVRCLREFSGNAAEYSSWKKSVDRILRLYEFCKGTPRYFGILNVIRNKIVGNADAALESYNTPLNWECISRCLTLHYADKRDLTTLEYQMTTLVQGNRTIQDFYQAVYTHLSLITNKLSCLDIGRESMDLLTQTYRDKALDTFIRGLRGDLPRLLGIREPTDLPQALQLCLKLENQQYRAQYANSHQNDSKPNKQMIPPPTLPPRRNNQNFVPFYPQLAFMPQPAQHNAFRPWPQQKYFHNPNPQPQYTPGTYFQPPRPFAPKPQPRPEPMDIDQSMRTRAVNYMNRPVQHDKFVGKRPTDQSDQIRKPQKMQRNFHLDTEETDNVNQQEYQTEMDNYENAEKLQPFNDYLENQYDVPQNEDAVDTQDFVDIHFLD